jgi:shikimate dehydrogenase
MSSILLLRQFLESKHAEAPFAAVMGNPIGHSLSPLIHNIAFQYHELHTTYFPILVEENDYDFIPQLFIHKNFRGANITIPLKSLIIDYINERSTDVLKTGACNTVYKDKNGTICGANTDISGFLHPLKEYKNELSEKNAIVFGSGGSSKAIVVALKAIGVKDIYIVSRSENPTKNAEHVFFVSYDKWEKYAHDCGIIINSTPLGMFPNESRSPVADSQMEYLAGKICYDIIYNPGETSFLQQAKIMGSKTINGLPMFIGQAAASFNLFTDRDFPIGLAEIAVRTHLNLH